MIPKRRTMLIFRVQVYHIFREISSISYSRDSKYDLRMNDTGWLLQPNLIYWYVDISCHANIVILFAFDVVH